VLAATALWISCILLLLKLLLLLLLLLLFLLLLLLFYLTAFAGGHRACAIWAEGGLPSQGARRGSRHKRRERQRKGSKKLVRCVFSYVTQYAPACNLQLVNCDAAA
jgi:hypothetical protein